MDEIQKNGLQLHTNNGKKLICHPNLASNSVKEFPSPDLCFICVKNYDLKDLLLFIRPKLKNETIIVPLMNGVDIYERIRKEIKNCVLLPTCVYVGSHIERPGVVIQTGKEGFIFCGPDPSHLDFKPHIMLGFFKDMNIDIKWMKNPYPAIWEKYLLVASFALVCTHVGQNFGGVLGDPEHIRILKGIMKEIISIANKKGISLPEGVIDKTIDICRAVPDIKPSYMRDVEKGTKNEGDLFGGAIIKMGEEVGVPTPLTRSIYTIMRGK